MFSRGRMNELMEILCFAGREIWRAESRRVELWGHPVCSLGGESFRVLTKQFGSLFKSPYDECLQLLRKHIFSHLFFHLSIPLSCSPAGRSAFWPWQLTPTPGEGKEWGVPHAPLHPPGLPVAAQGHDRGQPWEEAHGTRQCSHAGGLLL